MNFYQHQEIQFMHAYTTKLPDLGTQRSEGLHSLVKNVTNRNTPIRQSVQKICDEVRKKQLDQESLCNQQRIRNPRLIDRNAFRLLIGKIKHHGIGLVSSELDAAKSLAERTHSIVPDGGICVYDCELPLRYGLPCKC